MSEELTGDQLRAALKKMGELNRQLSQGVYPFSHHHLLKALDLMLEGQFEGIYPCQRFAPELIPEYEEGGTLRKWEVLDDVNPTMVEGDELAFPDILGKDHQIEFETLRARSKVNKAFGLTDAKYLLKHPEVVPPKLQGIRLVLAGTVLRRPDGKVVLPCLEHSEVDFLTRKSHLLLNFYWFGCGLRLGMPCVVPSRKQTSSTR